MPKPAGGGRRHAATLTPGRTTRGMAALRLAMPPEAGRAALRMAMPPTVEGCFFAFLDLRGSPSLPLGLGRMSWRRRAGPSKQRIMGRRPVE